MMMMMMIIILLIIIIIITFRGAIQDFFTISSLRREPSPTCNMSCYVSSGTKEKLSY